MKKVLSFLISLTMLISLTACDWLRPEIADVSVNEKTEKNESQQDSSQKQPAEPQTPEQDLPEDTDPPAQDENVPETETPEETPELADPEEQPDPEPETPDEPDAPQPPEATDEPQPPHEHSYTAAVTKKVTCTENGVKTYTCKCGDSYTEDISAPGHTWGDWKTVTEPTTSSEGVSQRACKTCKTTESKPIDKLAGTTTITGAQLQIIENYFLELVNAERTNVGVGTLRINAHLDSCAQIRSQEVVGTWSHTRPDGSSFSSVIDISQYPYAVAGENLAMTSHVGNGYYYPDRDQWTGSEDQLFNVGAWLFTILKNSSGHYANMIKADYQHCGIGITYVFDDSGIPYFYVAHIFGGQG